MQSFFSKLFSTEFMPHGHCFYWRPEILWLHVGSDVVTGLTYYSIPLTLLYFARKRAELPFRHVFFLFSAFIFACGTTHLLAAYTMWTPAYRIEGLVKLATAMISAATAVAIIPIVPRALALRSPAALEEANRRLSAEVARRQEAEAELRRERDHLTMLLSMAPAAVVVTDPDDRIQRANGFAGAIAIDADTDLEGRVFHEIFPDAPGSEQADEQIPLDPSTAPQPTIEWRARTLVPADGRRSTLLWVGHDVSDRQRAERLRLEKERAEAATQARREFVAAVSHDLRTPLNVVFGYCEMLGDSDLSADQRELLQRTRQALHSLLRLIDDLLDVSRMESGRLEVRREAFALDDCIHKTVELLRPRLDTRPIALSVDLGPGPYVAMGDAARVEQVLRNLLENAMRHTNEGEIRVSVQRATNPDDGGSIEVSISDTGTGIAESERARIFEPFAQSGEGRLYREGVGLGLAICKYLVEGMGGRIWVESSVGRGSSFRFTLPRGDAA